MSGWAGHNNCCRAQSSEVKCEDNCKEECMKFALLKEQVTLLESELRDTNKKVRSKLDFLLKRIQDLEEKSINNT